MQKFVVGMLFATTLAMADREPQVQLSNFPYGHHPETGWRITIYDDGSWEHATSDSPIKARPAEAPIEVTWVPQTTGRMSSKRLRKLLDHVRDNEPGTLQARYSASYCYEHPTDLATVTTADGTTFKQPAEVCLVVTHSDSYQLQTLIGGARSSTVVYSPLSAIEQEDPPHPQRSDIQRVVAIWRELLRATAPIGRAEARHLRRYTR